MLRTDITLVKSEDSNLCAECVYRGDGPICPKTREGLMQCGPIRSGLYFVYEPEYLSAKLLGIPYVRPRDEYDEEE